MKYTRRCNQEADTVVDEVSRILQKRGPNLPVMSWLRDGVQMG